MGAMEVLEVVFGVLLRVLLPLAITLGVALILKRFDDRWRAESLQESIRLAGASGSLQSLNCWDAFGCSAETRAGCRAFSDKSKPCWEIMSADGKLQESCKACPFRKQKLAAVTANA